jgi:hypothetical protein
MSSPPMDRRSFLAKAGRAFGGVLLVSTALKHVRVDGLSHLRGRTTAKVAARFSAARLDLLKEAYESGDVKRLISLLHPRVQWWGASRKLPGQRAPA